MLLSMILRLYLNILRLNFGLVLLGELLLLAILYGVQTMTLLSIQLALQRLKKRKSRRHSLFQFSHPEQYLQRASCAVIRLFVQRQFLLSFVLYNKLCDCFGPV
jgi:hypothetical protein